MSKCCCDGTEDAEYACLRRLWCKQCLAASSDWAWETGYPSSIQPSAVVRAT